MHHLYTFHKYIQMYVYDLIQRKSLSLSQLSIVTKLFAQAKIIQHPKILQ